MEMGKAVSLTFVIKIAVLVIFGNLDLLAASVFREI